MLSSQQPLRTLLGFLLVHTTCLRSFFSGWRGGERVQSLCLEGLPRSRLTLCCFLQLEMELKVLQAQAGPAEQSVLLSREEASELRYIPPVRSPSHLPGTLSSPAPALCSAPLHRRPTAGLSRPAGWRWPASRCPRGSESWAPAAVPGACLWPAEPSASCGLQGGRCALPVPGTIAQRATARPDASSCEAAPLCVAMDTVRFPGPSGARAVGRRRRSPFPAPSPPEPAAPPP